jgi:glycosyltransferase involved in cell wall biosynthesis
MNLFIVIPAYNAEKTIEKVFGRVSERNLKKISRFVVVDDGSTDKTADAVKKLQEKYTVVLLSHQRNMGYGAAQKTGYRYALENGADAVVLLHADGQYPPEMIGDMIAPILEGRADVVGGSRNLGMESLRCGMPLHRLIGNVFLTKLQNFVLGVNLTSYHSGYRAYSRKTLEKLRFEKFSDYFEFDSEMLLGAKVKSLRIAEIDVPTYYGDEVSYLRPIKYSFRVLKVLINYLRGKYI